MDGYVTYIGLFAYSAVIISIVALFLQRYRK